MLLPAAGCSGTSVLSAVCCCVLLSAAENIQSHTRPGRRSTVARTPYTRTPRSAYSSTHSRAEMHNSCAAEHTEHKAHSEQLRSK